MHRSITLLAFEGGGFLPLSFLVATNRAVSLCDAPCNNLCREVQLSQSSEWLNTPLLSVR